MSFWSGIPDKWRMQIVSAGHTVFASMVLELSVQLVQYQAAIENLSFTKAMLTGICLAVLRAGFKAFVQLCIERLTKKVKQ